MDDAMKCEDAEEVRGQPDEPEGNLLKAIKLSALATVPITQKHAEDALIRAIQYSAAMVPSTGDPNEARYWAMAAEHAANALKTLS